MKAGPVAEVILDREGADGALTREARCAGTWTLEGVASLERRIEALPWPRAGEVVIDGAGISALDSSGAWLLQLTARDLRARGVAARIAGLRAEFESLM